MPDPREPSAAMLELVERMARECFLLGHASILQAPCPACVARQIAAVIEERDCARDVATERAEQIDGYAARLEEISEAQYSERLKDGLVSGLRSEVAALEAVIGEKDAALRDAALVLRARITERADMLTRAGHACATVTFPERMSQDDQFAIGAAFGIVEYALTLAPPALVERVGAERKVVEAAAPVLRWARGQLQARRI